MNREELNAIYKELEDRAQKIMDSLSSLQNGFDVSYGYYNGHYHKGAAGEYVMDFFPIPVVTITGLCDIEIDLEKISVSTKLSREAALSYEYEKLSAYEFEVYGVDAYLDDFYVAGNTYAELVRNIENSEEREIGFSFIFSKDADTEEINKVVRLLKREGYFY